MLTPSVNFWPADFIFKLLKKDIAPQFSCLKILFSIKETLMEHNCAKSAKDRFSFK